MKGFASGLERLVPSVCLNAIIDAACFGSGELWDAPLICMFSDNNSAYLEASHCVDLVTRGAEGRE